jgi:hypothetical protein
LLAEVGDLAELDVSLGGVLGFEFGLQIGKGKDERHSQPREWLGLE